MTSAVRHGTATSTDKKPPRGISPGQASAGKEARQRQTAFTKEERGSGRRLLPRKKHGSGRLRGIG
jgi:hypothetical protein